MPTRQLRDAPPPTHDPIDSPTPDAPDAPGVPGASDASREPVLLGEVLFHTLAELARRAPAPGLPAQRTRPHP